jgi:hypothetical protein
MVGDGIGGALIVWKDSRNAATTGWDIYAQYAPVDITPPAQVQNLQADAVSCSRIDLSWDPNSEEDVHHYNIYQSTVLGFIPSSDTFIASGATNSYSDTGLTAETTYYYKVTAVDGLGNEGEPSNEGDATTPFDDIGPVTLNVMADPNPTNGASSVTLTAIVDDSQSGNSNITAAEYFINELGGDPGPGNGTPMDASDGTFDSPAESITASIDVSGWAISSYTLHVRGKDAVNWGAPASVALVVTEAPTGGVYVWDMVPSAKYNKKKDWNDVKVTVTIRRDSDTDGVAEITDEPVADAMVYMTMLDPNQISYDLSGSTNTSGEVVFTLLHTPNGQYTATVNNVTHDTYTYTPAMNVKDSITFNVDQGNISELVVVAPSKLPKQILDRLNQFQKRTVAVALKTQLWQNYPNPFNPETWIPFELSQLSQVVIRIYNVTGQLVRTLNLGQKAQGAYVSKENAVYWDGKNENGERMTSGIYFYVMEAGHFRALKKMVIMK